MPIEPEGVCAHCGGRSDPLQPSFVSVPKLWWHISCHQEASPEELKQEEERAVCCDARRFLSMFGKCLLTFHPNIPDGEVWWRNPRTKVLERYDLATMENLPPLPMKAPKKDEVESTDET